MGSPRPQLMSQALGIEAAKRINKYMANLPKPQGVLRKNIFFVNYVKTLCKHNYVNCAYRVPALPRENAEIPTSGRIAQNAAPHIDTEHTAGGIPAARRAVKQKIIENSVFVILTML